MAGPFARTGPLGSENRSSVFPDVLATLQSNNVIHLLNIQRGEMLSRVQFNSSGQQCVSNVSGFVSILETA
jgi:hypothetical protein